MTTAQDKIHDKKAAILKATLELIAANGLHATPMSEVARQAGVAAGTIYHYFSSKTELVNELYGNVKQQMGEALLAHGEAGGTIRERFFRFWTNLFEFFVRHPKEFNFLEDYANSPVISPEARAGNAVFYQPVIDFMQEGMQRGVLREMPIELMTALVYGNVVAAAKLHLYGGFPLQPDHLRLAAQASWDGVRIN